MTDLIPIFMGISMLPSCPSIETIVAGSWVSAAAHEPSEYVKVVLFCSSPHEYDSVELATVLCSWKVRGTSSPSSPEERVP